MLVLRDSSPRLAQDSQGILPPSDGLKCKDESSTPHKLLLSPFQNAINSLPVTDTATLKIEDDCTDISDTMERQNEAGGSQSRSNDQCVYTGQTSLPRLSPDRSDRSDSSRRLNPQQVSDAELARILQQELERAAGADAPDSASAPSHHRPLTLQGFGMPPVRPPQQGFPEHSFPAVPFSPMASWSAYDPQAYAEIERILRQTDPHAHGGHPHEANQQGHFFPPPVAIPLTPTSSQRSPTASRRSQASSAPSGNDSPTADHANSQRAGRPLTQAEVDAAMIAEEKRRRNTAASGTDRNDFSSSSSRIEK